MDDLISSLKISAAGMKVQGTRLRVISENLANADSLPTGPGKSPLLAGGTKAFVGAQLEDEANDGGDAASKAETGGGGPFRRVVREGRSGRRR